MWFAEECASISRERMLTLVGGFAAEAKRRLCSTPKKVLLLPPDITRAHCGAGWITEALYRLFAQEADVHVIPTLGQHVPHTPEQNRWMFGAIPQERIHEHDWRHGVVTLGEIPRQFVREATVGKVDWPIPVSVNRYLMEEPWDLILHIGHVVPHEVLGFANHNKNYFIGLGGKDMICASHMLAAVCGIENNLGRLVTPLRRCFMHAEQKYLGHLPGAYFQMVMAYTDSGALVHSGVYAGDDIETYLAAARASQRKNITIVPPLKKVVAVMQGDEFYSTWVANKAIYRTRKALADGGELIILAPGLKRFGEQPEVDALIRRTGYVGTEKIMALWDDCPPGGAYRDLAHATAHLIHGSTEGRFTVTYAPGALGEDEIRRVNYAYANLESTMARYNPRALKNGFNLLPSGEEIFFISTPSAGLWSTGDRLRPEA